MPKTQNYVEDGRGLSARCGHYPSDAKCKQDKVNSGSPIVGQGIIILLRSGAILKFELLINTLLVAIPHKFADYHSHMYRMKYHCYESSLVSLHYDFRARLLLANAVSSTVGPTLL